MAQSIKLTDNNYIDASGVYDSTQNKTQEQLNEVKMQNVSSLIIKSIGRLVVINGYRDGLSLSTSNTKVAQIDSSLPFPTDTIRVLCNVGTNAYSAQAQGYLSINTSGEVFVCTGSGTASAFYVSCSYIA